MNLGGTEKSDSELYGFANVLVSIPSSRITF